MRTIFNCIAAISLFASNNHHVSANMLRGRGRQLDSINPSTPTCDEVNSFEGSLFCVNRCSTDYYQCIHGEVLTRPMPGGSHCINGGHAEFGQCTERDDRCDAIEALNIEDKIMCTEDCSDSYLVCSNGKVTELPMADGTKCYRDGIVRTAAGHCVIQEEVITYFEMMDACMNYPDLEHCASTANATSPPYNGAVLDDGAWYFQDKVWFSYISTYSEEYQWSDEHGWYNGKGWDIFINIQFGHDQQAGRSRSIIASMDYGTTQIYKWNQYDLIDGDDDKAHYNCLTSIPEEPVTKFLSQLITNPAIIFGLGRGEFDIPDDDEVHNYTAQVMISSSELGSDYDGDQGDVEVLIASEDAENDEINNDDNTEPVITPTFLFKNVIVYDEDFFNESPTDIENGYGDDDEDDDEEEEGVELIIDDGSDMPTVETLAEIRKLFDGYFNVTLNETICSDGFEQVYNNDTGTDIRIPILNRGKLLAGTGEVDDGTEESIVNGTEAESDKLDPIFRRLTKLTKKKSQEKFIIRQDTIYDCEDGQVLIHHCCTENIHFLVCTVGQDCATEATSSSRCLDPNTIQDVILEPRFLQGNVPMQLHTAEHLEGLEYELDNLLDEDLISETIGQSRSLEWGEGSKRDDWMVQEEDDFTSEENFLPNTRSNITKWASSPITNDTEVSPEELWDSFGDLFLGRGGGLPNVKDLLADLSDLDETFASFYTFTTDLEGDMLSIYDMMHSVDTAEEELKKIDKTLATLDTVLRLVSIIKYAKPIAVPIRNAVSKTRKYGIQRALTMVRKVRATVTKKYKPKVKKALTKNEEVRGTIAKSKFLNQNMMINPFTTTRNCGASDRAAQLVGNAVDFMVVDTGGALEEINEFRQTMKDLVGELSTVMDFVDNMVNVIEKTASRANPIKKAMDPFHKALSTKITIPIVGPFCHKYVTINVPYPCGVKRCKKCRRIFRKKRCIRYPCGVKKCNWRKRVRLPVFCKKTFSFTIDQVLKGISGVMDIIFYPINKATDFILASIPMPDIPLLPDFPTNFNALEKMSAIGNAIDGPSFPDNLLDFPSIDAALPGLKDIVCGKTLEELYSVVEMAQNGDITPDFVREFYDGCGGFQDLNPGCDSTEELFCGDGGCPSPTSTPTISPTMSLTISPPTSTLAPTASPTSAPSANDNGSHELLSLSSSSGGGTTSRVQGWSRILTSDPILKSSTDMDSTISILFDWKDQGYSTRKGKVRVLLLSDDGTLVAQKTYQVAPHTWETREELLTFDQELVNLARVGYSYAVEVMAGWGGGHVLYLRDLELETNFAFVSTITRRQ